MHYLVYVCAVNVYHNCIGLDLKIALNGFNCHRRLHDEEESFQIVVKINYKNHPVNGIIFCSSVRISVLAQEKLLT